MAYGLQCSHCGWQEGSHYGDTKDLEGGTRYGDPEKVTKGWSKSLYRCPGFTYQREDRVLAVEMYMKDPADETLKAFTRAMLRKVRQLQDKHFRENPISDRVLLITPYGVIDIGS